MGTRTARPKTPVRLRGTTPPQDYEPKVDVSYTMGKHAMKFGFSYNRYTKNQQLFGDQQGTYGFGSSDQRQLHGHAARSDQQLWAVPGAPIRHYVNQTPSVYVMDNWHVTPRLSLQLGFATMPCRMPGSAATRSPTSIPALLSRAQAPMWNADGTIDPHGPGFQPSTALSFYLNGIGLAG